jgi:hypothetical protein
MNATVNPTDITAVVEIDPRLMFMLRAGACHDLVMYGEISIDEAFDGLIDQFEKIMGYATCITCGGTPCAYPPLCEASRKADKRRRRR